MKKVEHAATRLLKKRFLLPEDAERLIEEAKASNLGLPPGPNRAHNGDDVHFEAASAVLTQSTRSE